ncbi:MAG: hypothetical protein V2J89_03225 [Halieaceae bacterium]|jgi:uncharacterized protein involved in outer membrane biogenesis|nr:hypothetical protein [Halieaceae bacterium]
MGKTAKILLGVFFAAIVVAVIAIVLVFQNLDAIIKQVIEDVGSEVTKTQVTVSDVKFTLQDGRGEIYGLRIANPAGFSSASAFAMDKIAVQVAPASLTGPVIVIEEVTVDGAALTAEQRGATTNLQALLEGMKPANAEPAPPASGEAADIKLALEQFAFVNSSATVITQQFGDKTLELPAIRLANIGDRNAGLAPEALANEMLRTVIKQTQDAVKDYLEDMVKDKAKEAAEEELNKKLDEKIGTENRKKLEGLKGLLKQ